MFDLKVISLSAALTVASAFSATADEARDVVMQHLRGYGALDADAMTAPFADDARVVTTDRVYSGTDQIHEFMSDLVAEFSQPDISTESYAMVEDGNVVLMTWSAESPDNDYEFGVDTFVVENGEIVLLTTAARVTPK